MRHELTRLLVNFIGIDQNFADVWLEIITNGTDDEAAFLINQESTFLLGCSAVNGFPQLHQVIQVPLQFFGVAANGCRAGDQAHALRYLQLIHNVAQFGAFVALDAA